MTRALLIHNPVAARTDPAVIRTVCRVFGEAGWTVDVAGTTRAGDAGELARQGVAGGADVIAVYGGDGTTMQAVSGVVGSNVRVGLIPGGTGNVLAGNLRLPRNPTAAARVVVQGSARSIDIGRVQREDGSRYFAVSCGAGLDAELMAGTKGEAKRRWGVGAYVAQTWQALGDIKVSRFRVTVDGESFDTDAAMVLVANCRELVPPFLRLRRDIAVDDGWFDVVVVDGRSVAQAAQIVWQMTTGRTERSARFRFARGRTVSVETTPHRPVQLDGEAGGMTPFTAELLPGALSVIVQGDGKHD